MAFFVRPFFYLTTLAEVLLFCAQCRHSASRQMKDSNSRGAVVQRDCTVEQFVQITLTPDIADLIPFNGDSHRVDYRYRKRKAADRLFALGYRFYLEPAAVTSRTTASTYFAST